MVWQPSNEVGGGLGLKDMPIARENCVDGGVGKPGPVDLGFGDCHGPYLPPLKKI